MKKCKCGKPLTGPGSHEDDTQTEWSKFISKIFLNPSKDEQTHLVEVSSIQNSLPISE